MLASQGLAGTVRIELHQFSAALSVLQAAALLLTAPAALGQQVAEVAVAAAGIHAILGS